MKKKTSVDSLTLQRFEVRFLYDSLDIPLHGEERRARSKFSEILRTILLEQEGVRMDLVKKHAKKDKSGEAIVGEDKNFDFDSDGLAKFTEEYRTYLDEEVTLDILPSNQNMFATVKKILNESTKNYDTKEGEMFDKILDKFDA